jgi:hypothetical protein
VDEGKHQRGDSQQDRNRQRQPAGHEPQHGVILC